MNLRIGDTISNSKQKLNDKGKTENIIKCELCGYEFTKCDGLSCNACPINCGSVKCPNCGYEILPESKSYELIENGFKRIKNLFK